VNRRKELLQHYLTMLVLSTPAAAIVWFVFHGVYENLSISEKAVGYVDPVTQMGITLGYVVMVAGTVILAAIAAWSGFQLLRLLIAPHR
jgi:fucose permease